MKRFMLVALLLVATTSFAATCSNITSDGTVQPNFLAKFTAACNVQKSTLYDTGTKIGLGNTAPLAYFDVFPPPITDLTGGIGMRMYVKFNPAADSTALNYGGVADGETLTGNPYHFAQLYGMYYIAQHFGTGTIDHMIGAAGTAVNASTGTAASAIGLQTIVTNIGGGKINQAIGLSIGAPQNTNGGSIDNYYGLYIIAPYAATKNYSIYSGGGINFFAGNVGIANQNPQAALDVSGTGIFHSGVTFLQPVTFAPNQTFPGGPGGIGSIVVGPGLTGGGSSSTVNLGIDNSVVALQTDLSAERDARTSADATETSRAQTQESALATSIGAETVRAGVSEGNLSSTISAETTRATAAESLALPKSGGAMTGSITFANGQTFPSIHPYGFMLGCDNVDACSVLVNNDSQKDIFSDLVGTLNVTSVYCYSDAGAAKVNLVRNSGGTLTNFLSTPLTCSPAGTTASASITLALQDRVNLAFTADGVSRRVTVMFVTQLQ